MMRSWRLRRRTADNNNNNNALQKPVQPSRRRVYQPQDLKSVTLVPDAQEDLGLVWSNQGRGNNAVVVLSKLCGTAKLHPDLSTGMHLISINNEMAADAIEAREMCEAVLPGEALTLLLWRPSPSGGISTKNSQATNAAEPVTYVTASVYKETMESKTGIVLQTESGKGKPARTVRIARLAPTAPTHLRVGMRLVAVENAAWFSHHTEAVALIRSLPAGFCTLLFASQGHTRSNSLDASVATTALGSLTTAEDDASLMLDSSRRSNEHSSEPSSEPSCEEEPVAAITATPAPPTLLTATLTPEQAQQVVLTEDADDVVYLHAPVAHLKAGMRVVSVNKETLASAGHYEHYLQTAEEAVVLTVAAAAGQDATALVSATAVRPTFDTKTGLVLTNGRGKTVVVSRVAADSLFPTLEAGMQVVSINGHDWFDDYQEAIGLIRSLTGEITIVAQPVVAKKESV